MIRVLLLATIFLSLGTSILYARPCKYNDITGTWYRVNSPGTNLSMPTSWIFNQEDVRRGGSDHRVVRAYGSIICNGDCSRAYGRPIGYTWRETNYSSRYVDVKYVSGSGGGVCEIYGLNMTLGESTFSRIPEPPQ